MKRLFIIPLLLLCGCTPVYAGYAEVINPTSCNITVTENSTQYSLAIPDGVKMLSFNSRDGSPFRYAFASDKVAESVNPFMTCSANVTVKFEGILTENVTLYVASPSNNNAIEVLYWGP